MTFTRDAIKASELVHKNIKNFLLGYQHNLETNVCLILQPISIVCLFPSLNNQFFSQLETLTYRFYNCCWNWPFGKTISFLKLSPNFLELLLVLRDSLELFAATVQYNQRSLQGIVGKSGSNSSLDILYLLCTSAFSPVNEISQKVCLALKWSVVLGSALPCSVTEKTIVNQRNWF